MFDGLFDLSGKVAVVTGGYGYLGVGMVKALLSCGAKVIVAGRSREKFADAFSCCSDDRLEFTYLDICDGESVKAFFKSVRNSYGRLDVLVNNAQASRGSSQENLSDEDWSYSLDGIVGCVYKTIREVLPIMRNQGGGKIINISSMYGLVSPDFDSLYKGADCEKYLNPPQYGAAKAAMLQLTRYFAVLLGKDNIQVNAIAPGPFPNLRVQKENPEFIERLKDKNPLHQIGVPDNLSGALILLSTRASAFITGQTIQVDGGWTIW